MWRGGDWFCHVSAGAIGGQKRSLDPLELEFQAVMSFPVWVLGYKHEFSGRLSVPLPTAPSLQH